MTEFWFLCTALLQNVFYQCMKVQVDSFCTCSLKVMAQTKIQSENKQRAITKTKKDGRVMFLVHCTNQ